MELRDYQKEAVEVFLKYKRGIISLPTGTGKTIIALEVIKRLNANRVLIIVPTKLLKEQWAKIVKEKLNYYPLTMKAKPPYEKVAHIVTYSYLRRTPDALTFINPELIICDEAHHLGAENTFKKVTTKLASLDIPILMLTATPLTSAPYSNELIKLFPIIYDRGYNDLKEFIPKVKLILVPFLLTTKEKLLYNEYSRELAKISSSTGINNIIVASRQDTKAAKRYIKLWNDRNLLLQNAKGRMQALKILADKLYKTNKKTIFFFDNIEALEEFAKYLDEIGVSYAKIHSKCINQKKNIYELAEEKQFLLICKMGEEGVDLPLIDALVISSARKSKRMIIQKVGRVMRGWKKEALVFLVYALGTTEEEVGKLYIKYIAPDEIVQVEPISPEGEDEVNISTETNTILTKGTEEEIQGEAEEGEVKEDSGIEERLDIGGEDEEEEKEVKEDTDKEDTEDNEIQKKDESFIEKIKKVMGWMKKLF